MPRPEINQFPCLTDNYGVLVHDQSTGATAAIDAPDAQVIERELAAKGWRLTHILTTHHHGDHTAGNAALVGRTGCSVTGPRGEANKIPEIQSMVGEGDAVKVGGLEFQVIETPGHTAGHIAYWLPSAGVAFVGDTLFAIGCGRILEGSAETMWASLRKLMALPPETLIYCGHEYTVSNARFALTVDPDNAALGKRLAEPEALRAAGRPTLPTKLADELETNPFLRASDAKIRERLGMRDAPDWAVFAEIRERKNRS